MLCGLLTPDSGEGTCLGYDIRAQTREIKRHVGYMTQRFSFWEDLTIRENLRFIARMYGMADGAARVDQALEHLGLATRGEPARRHAVRRLEAAARARRVPAARPAAAAARRADRGRRSEGAARFLGGAARARRARHHRAGQHALHGRGRALPQARLHPLRQAAGAGHGRGGDRQPGAVDLGGRPVPICRRSPSDLRGLPAVEQVAAFGSALHVTGSDRDALKAALAPLMHDARSRLARSRAGSRGRVHPPDARRGRRAGSDRSAGDRAPKAAR